MNAYFRDTPVVVEVDGELKDLIPGFLQNRRFEVEMMKGLIAKNDLSELRRLGHSLKGSAAGYGFSYLSDVGKRIEDCCKAQNTKGTAPPGPSHSELTHILEQYQKFLEEVQIVFRAV